MLCCAENLLIERDNVVYGTTSIRTLLLQKIGTVRIFLDTVFIMF